MTPILYHTRVVYLFGLSLVWLLMSDRSFLRISNRIPVCVTLRSLRALLGLKKVRFYSG